MKPDFGPLTNRVMKFQPRNPTPNRILPLPFLSSLVLGLGQRVNELERLAPREAETLRLLAEGLPYKQIADRMGISLETVRQYVKAIYTKLHVNSRTEAVVKYLGR